MTNLVQNGNFELSGLSASGQASTKDGSIQYVTNWTSGSDNAKAFYQYGYGGEASYTFLMINAATTSSFATNSNGPIALWGQAKDAAHPNQISNGFTADTLAGGGKNFIASDGPYEAGPLYQQVNGLVKGHTYQLTFDWAAAQQYGFNGTTTDSWEVDLVGASGAQSFSTPTVTNNNHGFLPWSKSTFYFTATDASEYLSFLAHGGPSGGEPPFSLLDNVALIETPEPASWMTMILGFGAVGYAMRRRRAITTAVA